VALSRKGATESAESDVRKGKRFLFGVLPCVFVKEQQ
jgi:hypothetical protein